MNRQFQSDLRFAWSTTVPLLCVPLAFTVTLMLSGAAWAQCSGGRQGGAPPQTGSSGTFNPQFTSNSPSPFAYQQALLQQQQWYSLQQRLMQQHLQLAAVRQELMQRDATDKYALDQEKLATQQERLAAKKQKRTERLVALKTRRESEKLAAAAEPMSELYASASTQTTSQ